MHHLHEHCSLLPWHEICCTTRRALLARRSRCSIIQSISRHHPLWPHPHHAGNVTLGGNTTVASGVIDLSVTPRVILPSTVGGFDSEYRPPWSPVPKCFSQKVMLFVCYRQWIFWHFRVLWGCITLCSCNLLQPPKPRLIHWQSWKCTLSKLPMITLAWHTTSSRGNRYGSHHQLDCDKPLPALRVWLYYV